jgi:hypothetical protein
LSSLYSLYSTKGIDFESIPAYTPNTATVKREMATKISLRIVLPLALMTLPVAYAGLITASGAGALPGSAEDLTGVAPTEIIGSIPDTIDPLLGVNMFAIDIGDFAAFSAITLGSPFGITDTELFLFDSTGRGVYANDDIDGGNTLSCLPSQVDNPCSSPLPSGVGPTANGIFYLAITRSSNMPLSASGEIFTIFDSTDVVGPDTTAGGNDPITGWDGGAFTSSDTDLVNYDIVLTGTVPEPATWPVLGVAGVLLALVRRKIRAA